MQNTSSKPLAHDILQALQSVTVGKDYISQDPLSMADVEIREHGKLVRINDCMAQYFYELFAKVKAYYTKYVTRSTPSTAEDKLAKDPNLLALIGENFTKERSEIQLGECISFL